MNRMVRKSCCRSMPELAPRILVTGATGMVGANLVHRLVREGATPTVLTRPGSVLDRLAPVADRIRLVAGDLTLADSVAACVRKVRPDVVFHLATTPFSPPGAVPPEAHFAVNALGTQLLLQAVVEHAPEARVLYAGSAASYADGRALREDAPLKPGSVYGASKAAASIALGTYARLHRLAAVELRLFTVFGPWERARRLVPHVVLSALEGRPVSLGSAHAQRDFLHVDDVVEAFLLAAARPPAPGSVLNICSGSGRSVGEVAATILRLMGDPVGLEVGGALPRPDEIWEISGDIAAAAAMLGWRPRTTLEDGLARMIHWCAEHRDILPKLV